MTDKILTPTTLDSLALCLQEEREKLEVIRAQILEHEEQLLKQEGEVQVILKEHGHDELAQAIQSNSERFNTLEGNKKEAKDLETVAKEKFSTEALSQALANGNRGRHLHENIYITMATTIEFPANPSQLGRVVEWLVAVGHEDDIKISTLGRTEFYKEHAKHGTLPRYVVGVAPLITVSEVPAAKVNSIKTWKNLAAVTSPN